MSGIYTPSRKILMINSPIKSGSISFEVSNVRLVPEPSTTLSLLALGTLGAVATLHSQLKPSKKDTRGCQLISLIFNE